MSQLYTLLAAGTVPVSLTDMKTYMKLTSTSDDDLITEMLATATTYGENYTGREFRANSWKQTRDEFLDRIQLRRSPVASITSIKHLVSDALVTVPTTTYYLKKNLQDAEILLSDGEDYPDDTDLREAAIEIEFLTESYRDADAISTAIKRHVSFWYKNRGDCGASGGAGCSCGDAAQGAGSNAIYDQFRIDRV